MPKAERKAKAEIEYRHEYGEGEFLPNGLFIRLYYQIAAGGNMGIGVNGAAAVFIIVTIAEEETVVLIKVQRLAVYGDLHALVGLRLGYGFIGLEQLVKAYAVYAAEHYKVVRVGRGLRALPFAHGLRRKSLRIFADLYTDHEVMNAASEDANRVLDQDPDLILEENAGLRRLAENGLSEIYTNL